MGLFDEPRSKMALEVARQDVADLAVTVSMNGKGTCGSLIRIYLEPVQVKGNKVIIEKLKTMGWVQGGDLTDWSTQLKMRLFYKDFDIQ